MIDPDRTASPVSNETHNAVSAPLRAAEQDHEDAKAAHRTIPLRIRFGDIAPGQLVLDTETKQLTHAIRIAAVSTVTALARDLRINITCARANDEAHVLIRQLLRYTGGIAPHRARPADHPP